jgi:hypothetical protein
MIVEVIGRPPRTFEQWATAHADELRQPSSSTSSMTS